MFVADLDNKGDNLVQKVKEVIGMQSLPWHAQHDMTGTSGPHPHAVAVVKLACC